MPAVAEETSIDVARTADLFAVGGSHARLRLLLLIRPGTRTVNELADALDMTQPTTSFHLQKLRLSGLVVADCRGKSKLYRLTAAGRTLVAAAEALGGRA